MLAEYNLVHSRILYVVTHGCVAFVYLVAYVTHADSGFGDLASPWLTAALLPLVAVPFLAWRGYRRLTCTVAASAIGLAALSAWSPYLLYCFMLLTAPLFH